MPAGDHYLLTIRGVHTISGTQIQNAFVYLQQEGTGDAARLNVAFQDDVVPAIFPLCSNVYRIDDLYTISLDDPADYALTTNGEVGAIDGEILPIYNCWAFEYIRTTRAIQNGRKAIGIIPESLNLNGNPTSGALTLLTALENALGGEIDDAVTTSSWRPQLWRRPGTYESGVVTAPGLFYEIDDVRFVRISTQNTRKIGRGS